MYKLSISCLLAAFMLLGGPAFSQTYQPLSIGDTLKGPAWELIKLKGKQLYILDFWSTWCTSCIKAFPKMAQLQQDFPGALEVLLVNSYETKEEINIRLQKLNAVLQKNGMSPSVIPNLRRIDGDTLLKKLFPHVGVPHHVWIDGQGKVLAITHGQNATADHVKAALEGKALSMAVKHDLKAEGYDAWKVGLLQSGHPALKPAFYAGFIHYTPGLGGGNAQVTDSLNQMFRRSWINTSIPSLYRSAASHRTSRLRFVSELKDKQRFEAPTTEGAIDAWRNEYLYSYEMVLPAKDKDLIGDLLLSDLNQFFGSRMGIEGVVEKRKLPAYILVVRQPEKIKSNGGERSSKRTGNRISWTHTPISMIGTTLWANLENMEQGIIFINELETERERPADMELVVDRKDLKGLKKQLEKYGLDLLQEEREIEILVLRDKR